MEPWTQPEVNSEQSARGSPVLSQAKLNKDNKKGRDNNIFRLQNKEQKKKA